jgi:Ca2+-binding EF-hand superfamily protein
MKHDFNLFDAFTFFDKYNSGYLYKIDIKQGLDKLGIYGPRHEIDLWFKRHDSNGDGKLRFSEFSDAFTPTDKIYADLLNNRRSSGARYPEDAFSFSTRLEFANCLRKMLRNEGFAEDLRQSIQRRPLFRVSEAFEAIDVDNNGFLTKQEFGKLLEEHRFYATNKELDLLMSKYDKDRDGRVSYSEFFSETSPKKGY